MRPGMKIPALCYWDYTQDSEELTGNHKNITEMKKTMLLMLFTLFSVTGALGQSYYGEWRREHSNELHCKVWQSGPKLREEMMEKGTKTIAIMRKDSLKVYMLNPEKKTCIVLPVKNINTSDLLGLDVEETGSTEREFLRSEIFEGYPCKVYRITRRSTSKVKALEALGENVSESSVSWYEWICDNLKTPNNNGCVKHDNTIYTLDRCIVLRNRQEGPQPESLFEVPDGYTITSLPEGGLMEMFTGKSRQENEKNAKEGADKAKAGMDEISKKLNDLNNSSSEEEKIKKALEMLGGSTKKK